jgi:hypothetical protein
MFRVATRTYPVSWIDDHLPYDLLDIQAWYFHYDSTVYNDAPRNPNVENHSIDTAYSGLNKYNSREEPGYRKIVIVLRRIMASAALP